MYKTIIVRAIGIKTVFNMSAKIKANKALQARANQFCPREVSKLLLTNEYGTKKTMMTGENMIIRIVFRILHVLFLHLLIFKWSPGFIFSSIIPIPQPLKVPKWFSAFVALAPHAQQNSYLQKPQVMWLQPLFFSILVLHIGQRDTLSLFYSAQPWSYLFIASLHDTSAPCHSSRQLKHTHVWQTSHINFWGWG